VLLSIVYLPHRHKMLYPGLSSPSEKAYTN